MSVESDRAWRQCAWPAEKVPFLVCMGISAPPMPPFWSFLCHHKANLPPEGARTVPACAMSCNT